MRRSVLVARPMVAVAAWVVSGAACAPSGFQDPSLVQNGVRIFASRATEPYASPGDQVTVSALAYDGRTAAQVAANPEPLQIYWLPFVCENPDQDAYYACFPELAAHLGALTADSGADEAGAAAGGDAAGTTAGGDAADEAQPGDAGADGASLEAVDGAVDGGPAAVVSSFGFAIPADVVQPRGGTPPYGLMIAFNAACAGHLELLPGSQSNQNPQALPIGCFDSGHNQLGPESFVFGFTRVYAYGPASGITNTNPVITGIDAPGQTQSVSVVGADLAAVTTPFYAPRCVNGNACAHPKIGPVVPASSWELASGGLHEEIWVDFYATFGSFKNASRLLYDTATGSLGPPGTTDGEFQPPILAPSDPTTGWIWIVVHDSRGGAAWVSVPVVLQ